MPQVGVREVSGDIGWTFRRDGCVRRLRPFVNGNRQVDTRGDLIDANVTPGMGMDIKWSGFAEVRMQNARTRAGDTLLTRRQFGYVVRISPSRRITQISVDGNVGQEIDFAHSRLGWGATVNLYARVNPTDHLELEGLRNQRVLHVDETPGADRRLFVSRVSRLRATYNFTSGFVASGSFSSSCRTHFSGRSERSSTKNPSGRTTAPTDAVAAGRPLLLDIVLENA